MLPVLQFDGILNKISEQFLFPRLLPKIVYREALKKITVGKKVAIKYQKMLNNQYDDQQRLLLIVKQLEFCKKLIGDEDNFIENRIAIILLDQLAEIIMFNRCNALFIQDYTFSNIGAIQLNYEERERIFKNFPKKIELLKRNHKNINRFSDQQQLNDPFVEIGFQIGHYYRNAIYHRDTHNSSTLPIIAKFLFLSVAKFFPTAFSDYGTSFHKSSPIMAIVNQYELEENVFWFKKNADKISLELTKGTVLSEEMCRRNLKKDLEMRIKFLNELELPDGITDDLIKDYEFNEYIVKDRELTEIKNEQARELKKVTLEKSKQSKEAYNRSREWDKKYHQIVLERKSKFLPKRSLKEFIKIKDGIIKISSCKKLETIIRKYWELDMMITLYEDLLFKAAEDFDRFIQYQIDVLRGK